MDKFGESILIFVTLLVIGHYQYRFRKVEKMITDIHNHLSAIRATNRLAQLVVDDMESQKAFDSLKEAIDRASAPPKVEP